MKGLEKRSLSEWKLSHDMCTARSDKKRSILFPIFGNFIVHWGICERKQSVNVDAIKCKGNNTVNCIRITHCLWNENILVYCLLSCDLFDGLQVFISFIAVLFNHWGCRVLYLWWIVVGILRETKQQNQQW